MSSPNSISGLPRLPKALSIVANTANSQWQDSGKIYAAQIAMKTEENDIANTYHSATSKSKTDQSKSMSTAIARLRREMSSLRLLDASLLCQLMSLYTAIAEFRSQEERFLSEASDILEDDEDEIDEAGLSSGHVTTV